MGAAVLSPWAAQLALHQPSVTSSRPIKSAFAPAASGRFSTLSSWSSLQHNRRALVALSPCRAQASTKITFHFDSTAITAPFSQDAAVGLSKAIEDVVNTFREKEKAERPKRWDSMDFRHVENGVFVEFFCNPNAYANFFQAKALVTIGDDRTKIVTEAALSAIKGEVEQYAKAKV